MKVGRSSGILMHPSSLPGGKGIGTIGAPSREFIDFLSEAGQSFWQVLPLGPTGYGDSPYQCFSSLAGNPYLIDLIDLQSRGWLDMNSVQDLPGTSERVEFGSLIPWKMHCLRQAWEGFRRMSGPDEKQSFERFRRSEMDWLDDYTLFMSLKSRFELRPWYDWPDGYRLREPGAILSARLSEQDEMSFHAFLQFAFFLQWESIRQYAREKGVRLIGDIPLYVARDSADAWANPEVFLFDASMMPTEVAGVPPDYFSATGQLWGNPVFNWPYLEHTGFAWWVKRIRHNLKLADLIRIDHFRGLDEYWAVPYGEPTAVNGQWKPAAGRAMLEAVRAELGEVPLIAEDLGDISPEVYARRDDFGLPGMVVMQFAFDGNRSNVHIPYMHRPNSIVYTGTHDNDTLKGWLYGRSLDTHKHLRDYFGAGSDVLLEPILRATLASTAQLCIIPMQDWLGLDNVARMNTPGTLDGNWNWRCRPGVLDESLAERIRRLTEVYGRHRPIG
ncbi:MAG: 4-alpha-glucanotransferase [Bacteroidales bacterium]|nr:4-alpha-glucanotransferase [Bacteroidales bacterium]